MADMVTKQELANAKIDAKDLGEAVNEKKTVTPRYGTPFKTVPLVIEELNTKADEVIAQGFYKGFATETLLLAAKPTVSEMRARADNTRKIWRWNRTSAEGVTPVTGTWTDTGLSDLDLAKADARTVAAEASSVGTWLTLAAKKIMVAEGLTGTKYLAAKAIKKIAVLNPQSGRTYHVTRISKNTTGVGSRLQLKDDTQLAGSSLYAYYASPYSDPVSGLKEVGLVASGVVLAKVLIDWDALPDNTDLTSFSLEIDNSVSLLSYKNSKDIVSNATNVTANTAAIVAVATDVESIKNELNPPVFLRGTFNAITSAKSQLFFDIFKEITVENPEDGYYYNVGYYRNGYNAETVSPERWIIYKRAIATYETSDAQLSPVTLAVAQTTLPRTGNIEEITLNSAAGFSEVFKLKIDTSKLPAYGTFISATGTTNPMYSWYINPKFYKKSSDDTDNSNFSFDAAQQAFTYSFKSGNFMYKWGFGLNNANTLPNFKSLSRFNLTTNTNEIIDSFDSDWLPPLILQATNNGDSTSPTFTGGNHLIGGLTTAEKELFEIEVDGNLIDKTVSMTALLSTLKIKISNKVMAANTVAARRHVIRQVFDLEFFKDGSVSVNCQIVPLEDITLRTDYALQCHTGGFKDSILMLNSQYPNRVAWDANLQSGARADYPKAWAVIFKGSAGFLGMWIDRTYANGVAETNLGSNRPLIFGGSTTTKFYLSAFRYGTGLPPLALTPTSEYKWRGGYVMGDPKLVLGFDSVVKLDKLRSIVNGVTYF